MLPEALVRRCSTKKLFLKILQNSQENTCVVGLRPATFLKKRLQYRRFLVNFEKFLRITLFTEHLRWLRLCFSIKFERINFYSSHKTQMLYLLRASNKSDQPVECSVNQNYPRRAIKCCYRNSQREGKISE